MALRDEVIAELAVFDADVAMTQAAYFSRERRYAQCIATSSNGPGDGGRKAPELTRAPTDQPNAWEALLQGSRMQSTWLSTMRIDVYDGPQGKGYVVTSHYGDGGRVFERAINHGPETYRSHDWRQRVVEAEQEQVSR